MSVYIKNDSGGNKTYQGQLIADGDYYLVQEIERTAWANDSALLTDIGSADVVVAKDDSGSNDISDVNDGINTLKGLDLNINRLPNIAVDDYFRVRHKGIMKQTVAASTAVDVDWKIDQLQWIGVNKPSIMIGVVCYVDGGESANPPEIDFCVLDRDGHYYPTGTVLDAFGDTYYMPTDSLTELREHKADLVKDLVIRAHVNNVGNTSCTFFCNLLRYIDTR